MSLKEKTQSLFANALATLHSHHSGAWPREFDW